MHESFESRVSWHLHELRTDLPSLVRSLVELTEAVEAKPCSRRDAVLSVDSLVAACPQMASLLRSDLLSHRAHSESASIVSSILDLVGEQLSSLESGLARYGPRELALELHQRATTVSPAIGSVADLALKVRELGEKSNDFRRQMELLAGVIFVSPTEVTLAESSLLVTMDPKDAESHLRRGQALASEGQLSEALLSFQQAYTLGERRPDYAYFLALCLHDLKRYQEARLLAERAIELRPSSSATWTLLGNIHEGLGDRQAAVDAHLRAQDWSSEVDGSLESNLALQRLSADSSLKMPRPEKFSPPDIDERFSYRGYFDREANCRIRLFRSLGSTVVLATWDGASKGTSITNMAERLCKLVCDHYSIPFDAMTWLEHYEKGMFGGQSLNRVHFRLGRDGNPTDSSWREISHEQFESLTGFRLSWGKQR